MDDPINAADTSARASRRGGFEELERVRIIEPIVTPGGTIAAGSAGTVVAVWGGGEGYDVEFTKPFAVLVTVRRNQLSVAAAA